MKFTLFTADCTGNEKNTVYPHKRVITSEADLRKAIAYGKLINGQDVRKFGKQWLSPRKP